MLRGAFGAGAAFALLVGVASACSSFEESAEPDGDGGADGSSPPNDGALADSLPAVDATPQCVSEPIEPFDAGLEDAHCGPDGIEVGLSFSNEHCGFCGHACAAGNSCTDGACTAENVSTPGEDVAVGNAETATDLYFLTTAGGCVGTIRRTELGKTGDQVVMTETDPGCMSNLALRNGFLYYLQSGYGLKRTPVDAAVPATAPLPGTGSMVSVAFTSSAMYAVDNTYQHVYRMELDGSGQMKIHDDPETQVRTLGADDSSVWWTVEPEEGGVGQATLWGLPPGSSTVVKRASELTGIRYFVTDEEYIYLGSETGEVLRVTKSGATLPERVTIIETTNRTPRAMALIGDYLYVAAGAPAPTISGPVEIYRAKKCGGRARLVARVDPLTNNEINVVGNALYFSAGQALRRFVPVPP